MRLHSFHQKARLSAAAAIDQLRNVLAKSADRTVAHLLDLSELENRILLSASPAAVMVDSAPAVESAEIASPLDAPSDSLFHAAQVATPQTAAADRSTVPEEKALLLNDLTSTIDLEFDLLESDFETTVPVERAATEVIFVDQDAANFEELIADLQAQRDAGRPIDFFVLDSHSDGVDQIAETLEQYSDLDAVHIVSHGESGAVKLGGTWLRIGSLDGYAGAIAGWGSALNSDGDLLFYGCDLASNTRGKMLVHSVAALTGADVAASTDDTGHETFGGDWELEYEAGSVDSEVVFTEQTQQEWVGKLAVINVTTTDDVVDSGDGLTSLREAIIQSNMGSGGDTISLSAGTYTLSIGGTGEDNAATGDLDIREDVIIRGAGQHLTILNGNGIDRVFEVRDNANFTIEDLSVAGGSTSGGNDGAGIQAENAGSLTATRVIFTGNASGGQGGAIHASNNSVTLTDVALVGNSAATSGGGLRAEGVTTLTRVTVSGNSAVDGAGIYQTGGSSDFTLVNVTISGNVASGEGGGIWTNHPMSITNSTIAFNMGNTGAGIYIHGSNGDLSLRNSILASNTQFDSQANNVSTNNGGTLNSLGFNISSDGTAGLSGTGDQSNTDPLIDPTLSLNGGTTETHALQSDSPAINTGTTTGAPATDQRGIARDSNPDIGAFEVAESLFAYEPFDYAAGSLNGRTGGTGFATAWNLDSGDSAIVNATGLTAPAGLSAAQGGTLELNTGFSAFEQSRDLNTTLGTDGTTAWFSFLVRPDNVSFGGISFEIGDGDGATNTVNIGNNGNDWLVGIDGTPTGVTIDDVVNSGQTYFMAVQIDFAAGNDTVTLYVDPTAGVSTPDSPPAMQAQLTIADLGTFSRIAVIGGFSGNDAQLDEIRVGETFGDVATNLLSNQSPTADAGGAYAINEGDSVNLIGSGSSDPDTDPLTYMWDLDNDGNFGEPGEPTTETPTVDWATLQTYGIDDDGVYTIGLQVDDGRGDIDTTTTTLTLNNVAPTLSTTGTGSVTAGGSYTLNLSAADSGEDTIATWTINWGDGTIETITGNPSIATHTYSNAGFTNNIVVSASDEDGTYAVGDLIASSLQTNSIFRYSATDGTFLQEFGQGDVNNPVDVQIGPDGGIYVTGFGSNNVYRYDSDGTGGSEFVVGGSGGLSGASRMAFGADGNLYVTSMNTDEVLRYNGSTGAFIDVFADSTGNSLDQPDALAFGADGDLYVASRGSGELLRFNSADGSFDQVFATHGSVGYMDIAFGPDGHLWVTNQTSDDIRRYDGTDGSFLGTFASAGANDFAGIAFGADEYVYISDAIGTNDNVVRYRVSDALFDGEFASSGSGGLNQPVNITFTPAHQVAVTPSNSIPTADAGGPYVIAEGSDLNLDASGSSDPDTDPLTFAWDLDNDGNFGEPGEPKAESPTVDWSTLQTCGIDDDGVYTIGLRVDDGQGGINTTTTTLTVNNVAPTISTTGTGSVTAGGSYTLNLSAIDPGEDTIISWTINWGDGNIETFAGNPASVNHTYATGGFTYNVLASATDEDGSFLQNDLIVVDYSGNSVFRFAATTGTFLQEFATGQGLDDPIDAIVGPDGNLYVSGDASQDILRYNATTGAFIDTFVAAGTAGLSAAEGMAFGADGNLYVADYSNDRVMRFDGQSGAYIDDFVTAASGGLNTPYGLTFGPDENLYVNSFTDDYVLRFDGSTGAFIDVFVAAAAGGLSSPEEMVFGPDGNLYVASLNTDSVLRFNGTTGAFIDEFISSGSGGLDDSAGLAFGPDGNLYVSDNRHGAVHRYDGTTGAFIDLYVAPGAGGLNGPAFIEFLPEHQVTVGSAPNAVDDAYAVDEGATLNVTVQPNWFNSNWSFRQELSLDNSAQASNLIDHPILVKLHASAGDATNVDYSQIQDAGQDLRFVDGDGTVLAHEIELWDETGYSYIWVNVPQIDGASSSDFISMYYGNAAADDGQSETSVWNSGERAVLHSNNFTTDSSPFDNDGVVNNAFVGNGIVAGAALFNGVDGDVNLGSDSSIDDIFAGGGTISAWINPASLGEGGFGRIADKANTSFGPNGDGWAFQVGGSGYLRFEHGFSGDFGAWRTSGGSVSLNTWQHVVITFDADSASNDPRFFINGVEQTVTQLQAPNGSARSDAALDLKIGNRSTTSSRTFDGLIDEVRISDGLTKSDEVAADYDVVTGGFVSSSGVETGPGGLLDNDSDPDSDPLTVTVVSGPSRATSFMLNSDGSFSYEHDGSEFTTDSFVYQIDDGQGGIDTAAVNLTINPQNDPPADISLSNSNVNENAAGATIGTLSTTDVDPGDTHTYSVDDTRFEVVGGQLRLKAGQSLDFETEPTVSLTVTTTDSGTASSNKAFVISVNDLNDSPTDISVSNLAVDENLLGGTIGTVTTTDPDSGDSHTYSVDDARFEVVGGQLRLKAGQSLDFETEPTVPITITTTDSGTASFNKAFVVSVNDVNEAPSVSLSQTSDSRAENTDTSSAVVLAAISITDDALGSNSLTLSGVDATSFEIVGGNLRLKAGTPLDFETQQTYAVTVQVNDPLVGSNPDDSVDFTLTITDVDESPVVTTSGGTAAFTEDAGAVALDSGVTVSDPENADLVGAEVRFDSGFVTGQDDLLFSNQSGISGSYNATSGVLTLTGTASVSAYETALRSVTYSNSSQNPNTGNRVLRFTVNDGLNTDTATRMLTVTAQNDPANVVTGGPYTVAEGGSVVLDGSASSDVDNFIVEYAWDFDYNGATFLADATGSTTSFSAASIDGPDTRTVALRVRSDNGVFALATTTVTIANVAPTANADSGIGFSTDEDSVFVTGNVLANDTDPGPESMIVASLDTTGTVGQVIDRGDGTFTYDPNGQFENLAPGQSANDTFTYTVTDGNASDTASVTIVITGVNDTPTVSDQNVNPDENAVLNTLVATAAATDADAGDSVSWSIVSGNTNGAFSINNSSGEIRVAKPLELNFESNPSYSLTVRATDLNGGIDTGVITVSINDLNEAPTANDPTFGIAENSANGTRVGVVTGSDPDAADSLAWSILSGNTSGTFAINSSTGEVTVANSASLDFETTPTFNLVVEARDGGGLVDTANVSINVTNQNEAPTAIDVNFGLPENFPSGAVVGSVPATDPDAGDLLTWSIVGGNTGAFAINPVNGQLTVANSAALDFETTQSFNLTVRVQDLGGASDTAAVAISVFDQNEAPTADDAVLSVDENAVAGTSLGIITGSDPDAGDSPSWSILSGNTNGAFSLNAATGELTVANPGALDFETTPTYTLSVQIQDAGGLTDSATVVVNVSNVNEAPTTTGLPDVLVNEDSADVIIDLKAAFSDPETPSAALSYSIFANSNPALFSGTPIVGGNLILKFAPNANGDAAIAVRATDLGGQSVTAEFEVSVAPVADSPTSSPDSYLVLGDDFTVPPAGGVLANDSDPDGDTLSALLVSGPANGSLILLSNGGFTYTPGAEFTGVDTFVYEPFDGTSTGPQRTVVLNVTRTIAPPPPPSSEGAAESSEASESESTSEGDAEQTAEAAVEAPLSATASASAESSAQTAEAESSTEVTSSDEDVEDEIAGAYTAAESADGFFGGGSERLELRDAASVSVRTLDATTSNGPSSETDNRFRDSLRFDGEDLSYLVSTEFIQDLEQVEDNFEFDGTVPEWATGTAVATTASISVGYIMWMLRGGYVLASVLSTMPVWQNIDPLPVLAALDAAGDDDDDSLETMIDRASDEADDSETSLADESASDERKDEIV